MCARVLIFDLVVYLPREACTSQSFSFSLDSHFKGFKAPVLDKVYLGRQPSNEIYQTGYSCVSVFHLTCCRSTEQLGRNQLLNSEKERTDYIRSL